MTRISWINGSATAAPGEFNTNKRRLSPKRKVTNGVQYLAAAGLAPVAGRSGGSQDAVRDGRTGVVIENPRSVAELAGVILTLAGDDEGRDRLARNALEVARANFDWDRLAGELSRQLDPYDRGRRAEHVA